MSTGDPAATRLPRQQFHRPLHFAGSGARASHAEPRTTFVLYSPAEAARVALSAAGSEPVACPRCDGMLTRSHQVHPGGMLRCETCLRIWIEDR
jgi:hypothetical protein